MKIQTSDGIFSCPSKSHILKNASSYPIIYLRSRNCNLGELEVHFVVTCDSYFYSEDELITNNLDGLHKFSKYLFMPILSPVIISKIRIVSEQAVESED